MKLEDIKAAEAKLLLPTYERNPILFVDGAGMYLVDDNGNRYLDLLSGIGVNALGYGHRAITEAIDSADLVLTTCHPTDLELSTLGPTLARLKTKKTKHFVLLVDWTAGAARRRESVARRPDQIGFRHTRK